MIFPAGILREPSTCWSGSMRKKVLSWVCLIWTMIRWRILFQCLHPRMLTSISPYTIANFFQVSLHKSDISDEDIELFLETDTAFFLPDVNHLLCLLQKVPLHSDLSLGITIYLSLFRFPFLDSSIFCLPRNTTTITKANEHHNI